jgi:peroxiredoxin
MDAEILAISVFSPFSQLAYAKTMDLPYPLLSDFPDAATIKQYGVEHQIGSVRTAKRSYFIVDKKGIVRFKRIMHPPNPDVPFLTNEVLFEELQKINKGVD